MTFACRVTQMPALPNPSRRAADWSEFQGSSFATSSIDQYEPCCGMVDALSAHLLPPDTLHPEVVIDSSIERSEFNVHNTMRVCGCDSARCH